MTRHNCLIAFAFVVLTPLVTLAQPSHVIMVSHETATDKATAVCRTEVDAFASIANQLPRPTNWTFYIVCDEKTWKDVVHATGTAKKGFDYFSVTPTSGASVDTTKRVSYIRGWALIHPTKATPEPEFIVADTLARVILNTSDDTVARNQVTAWLKDRNTQVAAIK
jgi:hypothetical protein